MKNKLNIILVVALAVLTLFTFGCKVEANLGDLGDTKKWNNLSVINKSGNTQNLLQIKASEFPIDWWVITDDKGIVIEDYTITDNKVEKSGKIEKGETIELKFNFERNTNVLLFIAQDERTPKTKKDDGTEYIKGERDFRGRIPVGPNQGYLAQDSGYREEIPPVAILNLTCNETGNKTTSTGSEVIDDKAVKYTLKNDVKCYLGSWSDNYRITEIWPLSQVEEEGQSTPQWAATEGLKFKLDEGNYIEEGEAKKVIFPADTELVVALKQPDRLSAEERKSTPKFNENDKWYDDIKDYTNNGDLQDNFWWCIRKEFPKHETLSVNSYDCNCRFVLSANHLYDKSALGTTYIINESDIVDGSSEK